MRTACRRAPLWVRHADGAIQVRRVQLYGDQPVLRGLGWHGARREDADAGTERYRFLDRLDIIEVHRQIDAGAIRREISRPFGALKETSRPSPGAPKRTTMPLNTRLVSGT